MKMSEMDLKKSARMKNRRESKTRAVCVLTFSRLVDRRKKSTKMPRLFKETFVSVFSPQMLLTLSSQCHLNLHLPNRHYLTTFGDRPAS